MFESIKNYFKPTNQVRTRDYAREFIKQGGFMPGIRQTAKDFATPAARFAISALEAPRSLASGGKYTSGYHNIPGLGRINSFQDEARNRVNSGQNIYRAMANPMVDTVLGGLDAGGFAKAGLSAVRGLSSRGILGREAGLVARDFSKPIARTMDKIIPPRIENIRPNGIFREATGNIAMGGIPQTRELLNPIRQEGKFKLAAQKVKVPFEWESKFMQKMSRPGMTIQDANTMTPEQLKKAGVDPLMQEARKYKTTVNIQDKNDLAYLKQILSEDEIANIKAGKMTNWRGTPYEDVARVNLISETPKTVEQQLAGKIKDVKLKSDTFYHGTSAENARGIMQSGFKRGSELPENVFRGGGYGKMQNSISLAETPKDASRFSTLTKNGEIVETKLKPNSKVVSIEGVEDAVDLEDYMQYLKKNKIDAVYIGGGEKELVVINPKAVNPVKSQLTDIWNKSNKLK